MTFEYVITIDVKDEFGEKRLYERRVYNVDLIKLSNAIDEHIILYPEIDPSYNYEIKIKEIETFNNKNELNFDEIPIEKEEYTIYYRQFSYLNTFDIIKKIERIICTNVN